MSLDFTHEEAMEYIANMPSVANLLELQLQSNIASDEEISRKLRQTIQTIRSSVRQLQGRFGNASPSYKLSDSEIQRKASYSLNYILRDIGYKREQERKEAERQRIIEERRREELRKRLEARNEASAREQMGRENYESALRENRNRLARLFTPFVEDGEAATGMPERNMRRMFNNASKQSTIYKIRQRLNMLLAIPEDERTNNQREQIKQTEMNIDRLTKRGGRRRSTKRLRKTHKKQKRRN